MPIIATAASLKSVSAGAQDAPGNLERPTPQATPEWWWTSIVKDKAMLHRMLALIISAAGPRIM
jgi:hypothetical protein